MDWNEAFLRVIDLRSFSNIWYWLAVAVTWSTVSHWILGVPFDMIYRARRDGKAAETDLADLVRINVNRLQSIVKVAGLWMVGVAGFIFSTLASLGFYYGFELAQAMFCLAFPLMIVSTMSILESYRLTNEMPVAADLASRLMRHRFWIQSVAMLSIFVTAIYGMYFNLSVEPGF